MTRTHLLAALVGVCAACGSRDSNAGADAQATPPVSDSASTATAAVVPDHGTPGQLEYYGRTMLTSIAASLSRGSNPTKVFGRHPTLWYVAARRTVSGSAEVHDKWIDVTFVQAGRANLLSGGTVAGSHLESSGEHRGGTINGATKRALGSGDFLVIPAGIPHQYQIAPGDSLLYLTVKVLDQHGIR